MHRRSIPFYLLVLLFPVAGAIAAPKVRVDKAEGPLPQCQTFAWIATPGDAMSLTEQRVRTEVMKTLQAKGYVELADKGGSADKADCRIAYHFSASAEQRKSGPSVGVGAGGGSGGIGGGIGINLPIGRKKVSGPFTLDVVDGARNAQVWSGSMDIETKSAELSEDEAKSIVRKILDEYPDRTAGK
jgi:hypothetical protein